MEGRTPTPNVRHDYYRIDRSEAKHTLAEERSCARADGATERNDEPSESGSSTHSSCSNVVVSGSAAILAANRLVPAWEETYLQISFSEKKRIFSEQVTDTKQSWTERHMTRHKQHKEPKMRSPSTRYRAECPVPCRRCRRCMRPAARTPPTPPTWRQRPRRFASGPAAARDRP